MASEIINYLWRLHVHELVTVQMISIQGHLWTRLTPLSLSSLGNVTQ